MESAGALSFRDLWDAPIDEAILLVESLGYILAERASSARVEAERRNRRGRVR